MVQVPLRAASTTPSARRTVTRARPSPGANPAAVSNSASPHRSRDRRCRSADRTRSTAYRATVPLASTCMPFQHKPMRPALAPLDFPCPQMTHQKRNPERNVEISVEVGRQGKPSIAAKLAIRLVAGEGFEPSTLGYEEGCLHTY